jgi:hypothetical protein
MYDSGEGRAWTADEVGERLIAAFATRLDGRPSALLADCGEFRHITTGLPIRASDFITALMVLLGKTTECEMLMAWARSRAGIGASMAQTCRERGWSEDKVARARKGGCEKLARMLNALAGLRAQA